MWQGVFLTLPLLVAKIILGTRSGRNCCLFSRLSKIKPTPFYRLRWSGLLAALHWYAMCCLAAWYCSVAWRHPVRTLRQTTWLLLAASRHSARARVRPSSSSLARARSSLANWQEGRVLLGGILPPKSGVSRSRRNIFLRITFSVGGGALLNHIFNVLSTPPKQKNTDFRGVL